jgi:bacterioferritin
MRGDDAVLTQLNSILTSELTAINQYFLHSRMQRNWGYGKLAEHSYDESIDEMKHADRLIERILFLEGHPNLQRLNSLRIGENVPEQLRADLAVEIPAMALMREGIQICLRAEDNVTRNLLEEILRSEEEHVDWLETQLSLLESLGEALYLSLQTESS